MLLIGQFDSPFVRRVAIALELYGIAYDHRPWSTFGDGDRIAAHNPLRRVPTLVLDDGESLIDSAAILDYLDERAGPSKALIAASGSQRRRALKVCALATGFCDKAVSLFYERVLHSQTSKVWIERCQTQIGATLDVLEADRSSRTTPYWFGDSIGHADIAVACGVRFFREVHPTLFVESARPALAALAARCEALPPFRSIVQPFMPPTS
jgi:glutathione S-transferase